MDLTDLTNTFELSPVTDEVDLDATSGELNNNEDVSERELNQRDIRDENFSENSGVKKHKRIHNGEKTHECEICNKIFAKSSYLVQHRRIHSGEKPYPCEFCKKVLHRVRL